MALAPTTHAHAHAHAHTHTYTNTHTHTHAQMFNKVKKGKVTFKLADTAEKAKKLVTVGGLSEASAEGTTHSFSEEEKIAFVDWINYQLEDDADVQKHLPISEDGDGLFRAVHDGLVLW